MYLCGKTVNFLRLCQPTHPLCEAMAEGRPNIKLLVSPVEVARSIIVFANGRKRYHCFIPQQSVLKDECSSFVARLTLLAAEKVLTIKQMKARKEEERKELARKAGKRHR